MDVFMDDPIKKYYEILGLDSKAGEEEIKQAYLDMVKIWHPDRFDHDPRLQKKVQDKLKEIIKAYEELLSYRKKYNEWKPGPEKSAEADHPPSHHQRESFFSFKNMKKPLSSSEIKKARMALMMLLFGDKK
jgi:curved DNA-binding protein CbpA